MWLVETVTRELLFAFGGRSLDLGDQFLNWAFCKASSVALHRKDYRDGKMGLVLNALQRTFRFGGAIAVRFAPVGYFSASLSATSSAIARHEVRPGDSIPNK